MSESAKTDIQVAHLDRAVSAQRYRRTVDYLAAAQIYLQDNVLLETPLRPEHIKERLLGHWGTAPGINLIYAHLNRLILRTGAGVGGHHGDEGEVDLRI